MNFYRLATDWGAPFINAYLRRRLAKGREDPARFSERLGQPSLPRPPGFLVWFHAASVGESLSILRLIDSIRTSYPAHHILVTSGTVTSARLLSTRLPAGVLHQYVPVDLAPYVQSFLDHWKPDLALWVESELWPNMLEGIAARKIPAILLNARMSAKSYRHWQWVSAWAQKLLATFNLVLAQSIDDAEKYKNLGARDGRALGNLKFAAAPPPCDEKDLAQIKAQVGNRKVWLMASTHPGEDEIALAVHQKLRVSWPDVLTIIAPRHPARGPDIAAMLDKEFPTTDGGMHFRAVARRAARDPLTPATKIYLADTMGELGLFYRLCPVSCVAGSFAWGGHNPIEPAQLGSGILFGPRMINFADMAAELLDTRGAVQVPDAATLAQEIDRLWRHPEALTALTDAAQRMAARKEHILAETMEILTPFLKPARAEVTP